MKRSLKIVLTSLFVLSSILHCLAQTNPYKVDLPQILPASPDASSFVKAGVANVNLSTGAVSAAIPLYEIKIRDFTFPISLSYSTQGLKADEASSRVGMGWVLNATALITRSVRGKPDEYAKRMPVPQYFNVNADSVYNYCMDASSPVSGGDSQPDEFQFNCNGYSGKFVLDNNYIPRVTSASNIKVNVQILVTPGSTAGNIGTITLTTPDGVKYKFGTNYEITTDYNISFNSPYKNVTKTAFFLDAVELPTGEYITFNYSPINTRVTTGITQTLQIGKINGETSCGDCMSRNSYSSQTNTIYYQTRYLTGITASNGLSVNLSYTARTDLSYDNRLESLTVQGIKQFKFNYYDVPLPAGSNVITGRFFLTKIRELILADGASTDSSYDYVLTYDGLNEVPLPITFSQDYLGFYNGNSSNNYLIPPSLNANNTIDFSFRNPNWNYAKKGALISIKFPTGGREEFIYEANTKGELVKRNTLATYYLEGNGGGSSGSTTPIVYTYNAITVPRNQTVTLKAYAADAILNDGYEADPTRPTVIARVYEGSTLIASRSVLGYELTSTSFNLYTGHTYRLEMTVNSYTERGYCSILYDSSSNDIYDPVNIVIPGIRIKQIKYTDPATFSTYSKYYKYASLGNIEFSSGGLYGQVDFKSTAKSTVFCGDFGTYETDCLTEVYSSNSTNDVYNYSGSGSLIYYKTVIESDDPDFKNGGIEYSFFNNETGGNHQLMLGEEVPYLSQGQYPTMSGMLAVKRIFNKDKLITQVEQNDYETLIDLANVTYSVHVRKKYEPWPSRPDRMESFDVVKSHYGDYWIRQKSKTATTYAGNETLVSKTDYTYKSRANILPDTTITRDSKGSVLKTAMKYPTDFTADAACNKLVTKNIITPVIEQSSFRNGVLLQQKKVIYKDWFNDSRIISPQFIQLKRSPAETLQDVLQFSRYDVSGNPLQVRKVNDMSMVYLWDTVLALPLCEVKNAGFDQVAFCGFEASQQYGNWQLVSGTVNTGAAFTGSNTFTGTLTKSISTAGTYIVRLWTNSTATVNGNTGAPLQSARGWTLYEWKLVNPATITVQGTNLDDIRLLPEQAMMVTYTYKPFIGITSKSDVNGSVQYYAYDFMNRLSTVRDIDHYVLKNYAYHYADDTTTVASVWQPTGQTQCKPCTVNAAYYSTIQQQQEKDINPQSSTYNQTRWVDAGIQGSCIYNAVWQNTETAPRCVVDAQGYNTGVQQREQVDLNPCSSTYAQRRWVTIGTNYTACPLPCPNCTTIDKKCINAVCYTGVQMILNSVQTGPNRWECTYYYEFPDGSWSDTYMVISNGPCPID